MEVILDNAQRLLAQYGPSVLAAALILMVGRWVAKLLARTFRSVATKASVDPILVKFLSSLIYALLLTLVTVSALGRLGINTTSFVAVVGAAGLAVGLAFKDTLGNFASGVMLIIFQPFEADDVVQIGGETGKVQEVRIFATVLTTGDHKRIIMPNSAITNSTIVNYSAHDTRRVDMVFGIGYDDDIRAAKTALEETLANHPKVLADPAPVVAVSELADSSVNFVARPWVATADYWTVKFEVTEAVKLRFDREGISIPFPQRDVHLYQAQAS